MEENLKRDIQNDKKDGKSIRSVFQDRENNTIFIDRFNLNNFENKKKDFYQANKSSLLTNSKYQKINKRSLSEIPKKNLNSSTKSNLSQFQISKFNLLQLKTKKSNDSEKTFFKKNVSNTSININNNINNSNSNQVSKLLLKKKFIKQNFFKESFNNKETIINQSHDKSNINEVDNKSNNSIVKTIINNNFFRRCSTPIILKDEIFQNQNNKNILDKTIININNNYGLNIKNKRLNFDKSDFLKKKDFYYSRKFQD